MFTTVNADKLLYTEQDRLAHYTGGVTLARPGLDVKGAEIKAYLASAWGSKARFRLTQDGVGWSTVRDGMHAHGYAEEVYKAAPNYTDILVGIGAYNYFTGKIPTVLKPFAVLFGARGHEQRHPRIANDVS